MLLTDNETKLDLLNNKAIAVTITKMLRERPEHPVTVGVHGDWGAGKSSILEMIEAEFDGDSDIVCLKFNGWRFQGFEDAKIALIEGIVTGLAQKRPKLAKTGDAVKAVFRRIDWLKVAKKAPGLAITAVTGVPTPDQIQGALGLLKTLRGDPSNEGVGASLDDLAGMLKPKDEVPNVPKEIGAFQRAFDDLLAKAHVKQVIVLIDDLDRCLPETAIETLEAVRLFVFTSRTAFIVAADETLIEYAVHKHFPDLADTTGPRAYSRNYLEKLIQVPFRIPALGETETRVYVTLLLVGAALGEQDSAFLALVEAARQQLARPWQSRALDLRAVKSCLGDKAPRVRNALALSDQIGPILASGTKGNPRQIKRFLNTLALRQQIAEARGFGDDVKRPVLAKLMLAELFIPRLFDQVADAAARNDDGKCMDLTALETSVRIDRADRSKGKKLNSAVPNTRGNARSPRRKRKTEKPAESTVLREWMSLASVRAWAAVDPAIGDKDLRPYLFVAKDRKDYFGPASVLGHLADVIEKLFGPKLAVQALAADLKQLAPPEAAKVFEAVRVRIFGGDEFDSMPSGIDGLRVLVGTQPSLQSSLLDFLEALPREQLGAWVCSGWQNAIKDTAANQRFETLLKAWTKDGHRILKSAASSVLRTLRSTS